MSEVTYRIVEHDGGFAYKVGDVFSETFPSREEACRPPKRRPPSSRSPAPPRASATRIRPAAGTTRPRRAAIAPAPRLWTDRSGAAVASAKATTQARTTTSPKPDAIAKPARPKGARRTTPSPETLAALAPDRLIG